MSILLVDLSSYVHRIWHAHGQRAGGNTTSDSTLAAVRALARSHTHTGICCDVPGVPSFRVQIDPKYKASREAWAAELVEQYRRARDELASSCAVFEVPGFEADDLIATATTWARAQRPRHDVVIASSDKDVLQLLEPGVLVYSPATRETMQAPHVRERYGIEPAQVRDFLILTGDSSDGVPGVKGIGAVKASKILRRWGTLENAFRQVLGSSPEACKLKPGTHRALVDGVLAAEFARKLITLRTDAPIAIPASWAAEAA